MSVIFFLIALSLSALAVWIVIRVILGHHVWTDADRQQQNVKVARQRLNELQQREKTGEIDSNDAAETKIEIERELLRDVQDLPVGETSAVVQGNAGISKRVAVAVVVFIPLVAGLIYLLVGRPEGIAVHTPATVSPAENTVTGGVAGLGDTQSLEQLTRQLLSHLAENPEDALGWSTLGQLYAAQEQYAEAVGAYKIVRELTGENPDFLVREAEMLAMMNNGSLQGEPESLIETALEMDPDHLGGLWLAGLAAVERRDFTAALEYMKRAEKTTDNTEMLVQLQQLIDDINDEIADPSAPVLEFEEQPTDVSIKVHVAIEPSILEQFDADDIVFIFARAFNGPPAPLAVLKKQVKDLPLTVSLDDSMAMLPELNISSFEQVQIVARISKSGTAQPQSGDYVGQSEPVRPTAIQDGVAVTISSRVP